MHEALKPSTSFKFLLQRMQEKFLHLPSELFARGLVPGALSPAWCKRDKVSALPDPWDGDGFNS